jgi:outer membrane protein assembly factor BamB
MKNVLSTACAALGCVMIVSVNSVEAQDWPQWRGPNRDAKVANFNAPKTWPKELNQKWKVTVGNGDATPALVGDKLYVFTLQDGHEITRCLDASTGKEIWQDKYESKGATPPAAGPHEGPRSSPVVADGKVVTLGVRGKLSCLDAASGKKIWRKDDVEGAWPRFYVSSSPLIVNGLVIAQLGGGKNGALVAFDLTSGEEKWKWTGDSPGYASPEILDVDGNKLVIAETDSKVVAVNATDGKLVWEAPFTAERMNYNAATPVVDGSTLIYGGGNRGFTAVKFEKQGDTFTAKELWKNKDNSVQFNTPVLKKDLLFALSSGNQFFCINAVTGKTAWTGPKPQAPAGGGGGGPGGRGPGGGGGGRGMGMGRGGYGSIVDGGSVLLALTPSSQLQILEPSDKEFKELAKYKVADSPTYAYPVVAGNRVFIKDNDSVTLWSIE